MSGTDLAEALFGKAERAVMSALTLLADGDPDGACNRCYYAMFDAARAALLAGGALKAAEIHKTHSGVIAAFGLHLVKSGRIPTVFGRRLNEAEEHRLLADYTDESVDPLEVAELISQAQEMITCIETLFFTHQDKKAE